VGAICEVNFERIYTTDKASVETVFLDGLTEELEAWAPATQYPHTNYHPITHREDLKEGARKIEAFLT
jgi:hypothetical protein